MTTEYANKSDMRECLAEWILERDAAILTAMPVPPVPRLIGDVILDLCKGISRRPNFSGYTFVEEMVGDAILDCTRAVKNYKADHIKQNPFGYFSQIAWRAMLRRIELEGNQQKLKQELFFDENYIAYTIIEGDEAGIDKNELRHLYNSGE
jgi:hypothetical protein